MGTLLPSFKAYDIRGIAPDEIDAELAYRVGRAVASWSGSPEIIVGRDGRLSSPALAEALIDGLLASGATVVDVGMVTTPMLNFAVAQARCHGLMVTASHNPKQYNGIKVIDPNVEQVYYGRGLETIERLVAGGTGTERPRGTGKLRLRPIQQAYEDDLALKFNTAGLASVAPVIDCSNGVGGLPLRVLERLGVEYTLLNHMPDGNFPHHGPDTLQPTNFGALQQAVRQHGASLGILFDGDADRVAFVDGNGERVAADLLFILLARDALRERAGGRVFYDLRFSRAVRQEIEKMGGVPVELRVGNPYHKEALHRHQDALLAAELSGHIMYKEHFGIDDALFAALKLMAFLARSPSSLTEHISPLKRYANSGEIRVATSTPQALLEKIKVRFRAARLSEVDGISVEFPDWWFNLRASNTEPVAKLVIEATSASELEVRSAELRAFLHGNGATVETPPAMPDARR